MSQRYYEDVNVDDEIEPLEKLPTADLAIDFFGRNNPTNPAFADAEAGKRLGVGGALVPGMLKIAMTSQLKTIRPSRATAFRIQSATRIAVEPNTTPTTRPGMAANGFDGCVANIQKATSPARMKRKTRKTRARAKRVW